MVCVCPSLLSTFACSTTVQAYSVLTYASRTDADSSHFGTEGSFNKRSQHRVALRVSRSSAIDLATFSKIVGSRQSRKSAHPKIHQAQLGVFMPVESTKVNFASKSGCMMCFIINVHITCYSLFSCRTASAAFVGP